MPIYLPRLTVLAASLTAISALIAHNNLAFIWLGLAYLSLCLGLWLARINAYFWILATIPLLSIGYAHWRAPSPNRGDLCQFAGREIIFKGKLVSKSHPIGLNSQFVIKPDQLVFPDRRSLSGNAQLIIRGQRDKRLIPLMSGDLVQVTAFIRKPSSDHVPWQTDMALYFARQGIFARAEASVDKVIRLPSKCNQVSIWACADLPYAALTYAERIIDELRQHIAFVHNVNLGQQCGSLFTSMVLGERAVDVDRGVVSSFRDVGLSHLLAASGFNLTVVTAISYWLARRLMQSRRAIGICALANMAAFVLLAGLSASVLRAALMCTLLILAKCANRCVNSLAALGGAMLLTILLDPGAIVDPGCQLSYAATAGIICGARPLFQLVASRLVLPPLKSIAESACVVISAQAAIVPIQLHYFWQIGLLFLPANLLVASLVAPVTVLGFISSLLVAGNWAANNGFMNIMSSTLDAVALFPLKAIIMTAGYFASFKAAVIPMGPPSLAAILSYYMALFALVCSLRHKRWRTMCLIGFLFANAALFWRPFRPQLTIAIFPQAIVVFGNRSEAYIRGEESRQIDQYCRYCGVRPRADTHINWRKQCPIPDCVVESDQARFHIFMVDRAQMTVPDFTRQIENEISTGRLKDKPTYHPIVIVKSSKGNSSRNVDDHQLEQILSKMNENVPAGLIVLVEHGYHYEWVDYTYNLAEPVWAPTALASSTKSETFDLRLITCPYRTAEIRSNDLNVGSQSFKLWTK